MSNSTYIGRFAPSPSGPLHLGSLMSATCSYLQAKSNQGKWLVRIEDVDTPRIVKGAADIQLNQLESFGFEWDGEVVHQSSRLSEYNSTIKNFIKNNKVYGCECSRNTLKATAKASEIGFIYPRNCFTKQLDLKIHTLRYKTQDKQTSFIDKVYGLQQLNIQKLSSDWILKRADGVISYHLAVVLDDAFQGITEVVRGLDILPLTPLHIELQQDLNITKPNYLHHPLIEENGRKLSKQNHAAALNQQDKILTLNLTLKALGQEEILVDKIDDFWTYAIQQWDYRLIPTHNYSL